MQAAVGDRLVVHGRTAEMADREGEIIEIRGDKGEPPYLVRFADGHSRLLYPGPDTVIQPRQSRE